MSVWRSGVNSRLAFGLSTPSPARPSMGWELKFGSRRCAGSRSFTSKRK
jgi:hypothetical protein